MSKVEYYMNLPYTYIINRIQDESGTYYHSYVLELDGCQSTGETYNEAYESLIEAMEGWLELKINNNDNIPMPIRENDFSGKFIIRIPKSLHHRLSIKAKEEGVSLNQYALYKLSL